MPPLEMHAKLVQFLPPLSTKRWDVSFELAKTEILWMGFEVGCGKSSLFGALFSAQLADFHNIVLLLSNTVGKCKKRGDGLKLDNDPQEVRHTLTATSFICTSCSLLLPVGCEPSREAAGFFQDLVLSTPGGIRDGLGCGIPGCI